MAIKIVPVQCSVCGASLEVSSNTDSFICEYCGTRLIFQNDNEYEYEYNYNYRNEADVIRAQTERDMYLDRIREKEERLKRRRIILYVIIAIFVILVFVGLILGVITNNWDYFWEVLASAVAICIYYFIGKCIYKLIKSGKK